MRTKRARRTALLAASATALLSAALGVTTGSASAAEGGLTVTRPSATREGGLRVTVTLPRDLSGRALAPGALTAVQDGRRVPVEATRVVDGPLELVVALDASEGPRALAEEQAAAVDLLRALPPTTPTTVLPGGRTAPASEALALVGQVVVGPGGLLDGLPPGGEARRAVVLLTGCPALSEADQRAAALQTQVFVLVRQVDCGAAVTAVTGGEPGVVRTGLDAAGLLAGADEVARALLGRYDVTLSGPLGPDPVDLAVPAGGAAVATGQVLPPRAAAAGPSPAPASPAPAAVPSAAASPAPQALPSAPSGGGDAVDGRLLAVAALLAAAPFAYVLVGLRRRQAAATG